MDKDDYPRDQSKLVPLYQETLISLTQKLQKEFTPTKLCLKRSKIEDKNCTNKSDVFSFRDAEYHLKSQFNIFTEFLVSQKIGVFV